MTIVEERTTLEDYDPNFFKNGILELEEGFEGNFLDHDSIKLEAYEERHGIPNSFLNVQDEQATYYNKEVNTTSAAIKKGYEEKFKQLEAAATEKVIQLVDQAMNDYVTKKQNGENISYFYFFRTYYPKVTSLQNEIEAAFETKYSAVQNELAIYGYSPEKAEKFKNEFEKKKSDLKRQLMMKVVENF